MADDWKAWLDLILLVAVTLLAVGRWIFGRETSDQNHTTEIARLRQDIDRVRERTHELATALHRGGLQMAALEERQIALRERLERLEGRRHRQQD